MRKLVAKLLVCVLSSIMAGIFIALATKAYLMVENKIIGSLLFSFGLLVILSSHYHLYTGKVGGFIHFNLLNKFFIILVAIFNLVGIKIYTLILKTIGINEMILEKCKEICANKLLKSNTDLFILAVLCGVLMYVAVKGYKLNKLYLTVLSIVVFILCGFEHSIADSVYFMIADMFKFKIIVILLLGNGVGSVLMNEIDYILTKVTKYLYVKEQLIKKN